MSKNCENLKTCPIYLGNFKVHIDEINNIKSIFCESGKNKTSCKRYMVFNKIHYCPEDLRPDDERNLDIIIDEILDEEIK